jgi:predicted acylesterase/phospholipase RssA/CRP-like cAMP-binding protein
MPTRGLEPFAGLAASVLDELAANSSEIVLEAGATLFRQGEPGDAVYVVAEGRVQVRIERADDAPRVIADVLPGECVGEMALLTRQPRTATAVAVDEARLARIPIDACERVMAASPEATSRLVDIALQRMRTLYLAACPLGGASAAALTELDRSSTWISLRAGQTLFRKGETPRALYLVVHGSLEVLHETGGAERGVLVVGRGAFIGEMGLLLGEPRTATVRARRDSELISVPREAFHRAIVVEPNIAVELARQLAQRLSVSNRKSAASRGAHSVTVVSVDRLAGATAFTGELARALGAVHLEAASLDAAGLPALGSNELADLRIRHWLLEQEELHPFVVYQADETATNWTRLTLRQADLILLVGGAASSDSAAGPLDRELASDDLRAPIERVLLHGPVRTPLRDSGRIRYSPRKIARVHHVQSGRDGGIARLARSIRGTSTGLVLAGGGARGLAHIGVIRALRDAGIAIDHIGGTSMGAIVAALCALGHSPEEMLSLCRRYYAERGGLDVTLPIVALRSARQTVRTLRALFGDVQIEDLQTPFFCVSADLTHARVVVHDEGPLWLAVRASCAVPGLVPPVPYRGSLLVDGGLLNNLPADVMRDRCRGSVIAVDVSPKDDLTVTADGPPEMSGWPQLWARMRPSAGQHRFPSIVELLSRAVLLGSVRDSEFIGSQADLYLHPPVDAVPMSAFRSIDAIVELGYAHASEQIGRWMASRERLAHTETSSALL